MENSEVQNFWEFDERTQAGKEEQEGRGRLKIDRNSPGNPKRNEVL